jgi:hypothetical protein
MIFPKMPLLSSLKPGGLLVPLLVAFLLAAALPALAQDGPRVVKILGRAEILSAGTWREVKTGERLARGEAIRPSVTARRASRPPMAGSR